MATVTLADLLVLNDKNSVDNGASDVVNMSNFLKILPAIPSSLGATHQWLKETAAPVVGFRDVDVGLAPTTGGQTLVTAVLKILGGPVVADVALAKAFKNGAEGLMARETRRYLEAALFAYEKQLFYGTGTGGSAAGFLGFANSLNALANANVVNAGGTTAATASSVYLVRVGGSGISAVAGGALEIGAAYEGTRADPDDINKLIPIFGANVSAYVGLQNADAYSVVRIANVTDDAGHGVTDDLIAEAYAKFPADRPPTHIVMNRRSLKQLKQSRTATNPTGAPAPRPTESDGTPIIVVESLLNTEALLV